MRIRRLQYNIDYIHILTFRDEYKEAIAPYFAFDKVEYQITNENTINETIRLTFKIENFILLVRKEGISFTFEGEIADLKNPNGVFKIFWDIFAKIRVFKGFTRTHRHVIIAHAVELTDKVQYDSILKADRYFKINPFGELEDFLCKYDFKRNDIEFKFSFGNFSEKDIKTHELTPLKTEYNADLEKGVGVMMKIEAYENEKAPTFSKFKSLLSSVEGVISNYNYLQDD